MGNHLVGKFFVVGLISYSNEEIDNMSKEKAMRVLEAIGNKVIELTSLDAEFDDYANPDQPLGRILMKAFIPHMYDKWKNKKYVSDDMDEVWHYQLWKPFVNKFGFC